VGRNGGAPVGRQVGVGTFDAVRVGVGLFEGGVFEGVLPVGTRVVLVGDGLRVGVCVLLGGSGILVGLVGIVVGIFEGTLVAVGTFVRVLLVGGRRRGTHTRRSLGDGAIDRPLPSVSMVCQ